MMQKKMKRLSAQDAEKLDKQTFELLKTETDKSTAERLAYKRVWRQKQKMKRKKKMEHTLELSDSPRSAARQFFAFLISNLPNAQSSIQNSTDSNGGKSEQMCPNESHTRAGENTHANNDHK